MTNQNIFCSILNFSVKRVLLNCLSKNLIITFFVPRQFSFSWEYFWTSVMKDPKRVWLELSERVLRVCRSFFPDCEKCPRCGRCSRRASTSRASSGPNTKMSGPSFRTLPRTTPRVASSQFPFVTPLSPNLSLRLRFVSSFFSCFV